MKIEEIEIYAGEPDFQYTPLRSLEAKCEAGHAFANAPSMDEVNTRLKALAAKVGANAIINVSYDSGVSLTSWRALWGRGMAVRRVSDERACPFCAEKIKRAAVKCRFCGEDVSDTAATAETASRADETPASTAPSNPVVPQEPLTSSDGMPAWAWLLIGAVVIVGMLITMGGM